MLRLKAIIEAIKKSWECARRQVRVINIFKKLFPHWIEIKIRFRHYGHKCSISISDEDMRKIKSKEGFLKYVEKNIYEKLLDKEKKDDK